MKANSKKIPTFALRKEKINRMEMKLKRIYRPFGLGS